MKQYLKTIRKFFKELTVFIIITMLFLTLFSAFNTAYGAANDNGATLIAQTGGAGGAPPSGGAGASAVNQGGEPTSGTSKPTLLIPLKETGYEELPKLSQTTPGGMLNEFVGGIFKNIKFLLTSVAVLFFMIAAVKLIVAGDNEEVATKQKQAITYAIIALAVIGFADEMAKVLSVADVCPLGEPDCAQGGFLSSPSAMIQQSSIFNREVKIFITFIKYLVGGIAVFMLVRNGIRFVALQGNEESVTVDKKNIAFTSVGLILIILASTIIDKVLFIVDTSRYPTTGGIEPAINPARGIQELIGITNWAVTIVTPIAIIVLIAGAVMYATAGGNEETMNKAKRMIFLAILGMVLIFGAFAIVSTIISGQFTS